VTKFKFEFDNVREQFQQIQNLTNVLSALFCYGMRIRGKIFVLRLILYAQTARECRQTCFFFSNSTYHTNYSYWMCNI